MTTMSPASANRVPWVDALRGAAAMAVVLFHIYTITYERYAPETTLMASVAVRACMDLAHWGFLGVPVFFVLSGFCVGQAWLKSRSTRQFAGRRWRRIFPAYYASLLLLLGCVLAVKLVTGTNDIARLPTASAPHLLATATLLTYPASSTPTLNWVYWTLTYEVVFYAILTALLVVPGRARLVTLAILHTAICILGVWPNLALSSGPLFFCSLWPLFGLGLAVALAPSHRSTSVAVGLVSLLATVQLIVSGRHPELAAAALAAASLIALGAAGIKLPHWRLLGNIGVISYSLYLIHVPLLLTIGRYLILRTAQTPARLFLGVAGLVALILVSAFIFHRWFERPFLSSRLPARVPLSS